MTKKYAVLGSPISHSLSPKIHNYCFEQLVVDAQYTSHELSDGLADFLSQSPEYLGFSVTMPLKDQAYQVSDELTELARVTKSVNTLTKQAGKYKGHNTDVLGIRAAIDLCPASVAVLGSGATARSALAAFPDARKLIHARNAVASESVSEQFEAEVVSAKEAFDADVLISTLPKGVLVELSESNPKPNVLLDAVYTNPEIQCQRYVSGIEMLIHQAIFQQRIFALGDEEKPIKNEPELLEGLRKLLSVAK